MRGTIREHRLMLGRKPFLRAVYREWYTLISASLGTPSGLVLEIGSGPGFLQALVRDLIRSDVVYDPLLDAVLDATALPFGASTLGGIVGINVFHHLSSPTRFLSECVRTVRCGGRVVLLEPWNTPWCRLCMRLLHQEPFVPDASWKAENSFDPQPNENNARAWIMFCRDQRVFTTLFPHLRVVRIMLLTPFAYVLSGGVHRRMGLPGWTYALVRQLELLCRPFLQQCAMFALIVLERGDGPGCLSAGHVQDRQREGW